MTSWIQVLLELQRDWTRHETYDGARAIVESHGGGYGIGLAYAREMHSGQADASLSARARESITNRADGLGNSASDTLFRGSVARPKLLQEVSRRKEVARLETL